jgi:hypothetical protein
MKETISEYTKTQPKIETVTTPSSSDMSMTTVGKATVVSPRKARTSSRALRNRAPIECKRSWCFARENADESSGTQHANTKNDYHRADIFAEPCSINFRENKPISIKKSVLKKHAEKQCLSGIRMPASYARLVSMPSGYAGVSSTCQAHTNQLRSH